jgi:thioredoxin-dependent peroxiredoxin
MSQRDKQVPPAKRKVQDGDQAPDFTLPSQTGMPLHLGDLLGQTNIVLYFYPRDNTTVCTAEACAFRDSYKIFKDAGTEVIGISSDTIESHQQFAAKHHLPFPLLSDVEGTLRERYGVSTSRDSGNQKCHHPR